MDVSEVKDRKTLEEFLQGFGKAQLRSQGLYVASSAAIDVLPVVAKQCFVDQRQFGISASPEQQLLCYFGGALVSSIAHQYPVDRAGDFKTVAKELTLHQDHVLHRASYGAAFAVYDSDDFAELINSVVIAVEEAERSAKEAYLNVWPRVRSDLVRISEHRWPNGMPSDLAENWRSARAALLDSNQGWDIWVLWYERMIAGQHWHHDAMWAVLQTFTSKEDWEGDVGEINKKFDRVLDLFKGSSKSFDTFGGVNKIIELSKHGEDVRFGHNTKTFSLVSNDQIENELLREVISQIEEATEVFDWNESPNKMYSALLPEVERLETALERYDDRPVMLLKRVQSVETRVRFKIETGVVPTDRQDENIAEFLSALSQVQLELVAFSDEVKSYLGNVKSDFHATVRSDLTDGSEAILLDADEKLGSTILDELSILRSEDSSDEELRGSILRLSGILARSYRSARPYLKETASFIKDAGVIAGSTGAGIAWLSSPAFREFVRSTVKLLSGGQ